MADETTTARPDGAGLFKEIGAGGSGSYFHPETGSMFVGEFKGCKDAGPQDFEGKKSNGVWWSFDLYKMGDPSVRVRYTPDDGPDKGTEIEASADGRTTDETGPKSKSRAWFKALLQRDIENDEKIADVYTAALGKRALLVFGPSTTDAKKTVLSSVLPFRGTD